MRRRDNGTQIYHHIEIMLICDLSKTRTRWWVNVSLELWKIAQDNEAVCATAVLPAELVRWYQLANEKSKDGIEINTTVKLNQWFVFEAQI